MEIIFKNKRKKELTNVEFCDIIIYLDICQKANNRKEYKISMENKTESTSGVEFVADALISIFKNTTIKGKHVRCSRTKLGKLLTIIQILYIKLTEKQLFDDEIYLDICGTIIPSLNTLEYPYDIVGKTIGSETDNCFENNEKILESLAVCENDNIITVNEYLNVDIDIDQIIHNVFIEFGSYEGKELGKYLDAFKKNLCDNNCNFLSKDKVLEYVYNIPENQLNQDNPIITYIASYI